MNFSAQNHAEKSPQIPQNFQQVRAARASRFWTLRWATLILRVLTCDGLVISAYGGWDGERDDYGTKQL